MNLNQCINEKQEICVWAQPRARQEGIEGVVCDAAGKNWLKIKVTSPPEDGKANLAIIKILAKELGIPKSSLELVAGATSRQKRIRINS